MNVDTGELRRLARREGERELIEKGFTQVPAELQEEASKKLGSHDSTIIDMKKDSPLTNWANQSRAANKKKAKNKTAKASRRRNQR